MNETISNQALLRRLRIKNFKSIFDDTIELGRFNVFIGANGCGKTNILESLAAIGASKDNDFNFEGMYSRGVRIARPDLMLSSFLSVEKPEEIKIELSFISNEVSGEIKSSLYPIDITDIYSKWGDTDPSNLEMLEEWRKPASLRVLINDAISNRVLTENGSDIKIDIDKVQHEVSNKIAEVYKYNFTLSDYVIFNLNTKSLRGISPADSRKTPLGINGEGLDLLIANFSEEEKKYLESCEDFFDWLLSIESDSKEDRNKLAGLKMGRSTSTLYFKDRFMHVQNNILSAENSNEGILHVLFYLALFISNKTPNLFAIDNIETALNPRLCQVLIAELVKLSKERGKQVLITTHNPAILDGLNLLDDEQRLFEVYRNDDGHTQTRRIKFKPDLSDKPYKLSEMWTNGLLGAIPRNF